MPGHGPPPKDPSKRARRNRPPELRVIEAERGVQPHLPAGIDWPVATLTWWSVWADSPLATEFTDDDWSYLLDTAVLHAQFWNGDYKLAAELRLRVAKFGATPEDRARLRIQFGVADDVEAKAGARESTKERREGLRLAQ